MDYATNLSYSAKVNQSNAAITLLVLKQTASNQVSIHFTRVAAILPYILILLSISTVLAVLVVLVAFYKNRSIRTSFNVYLMSLLLADVLTALFDIPFTVAELLQPSLRFTFIGCNFRLYAEWMFSSVVRNMHVLISFNRIWALFWPYSYRHYHTTKVAVGICVGGWVYVHAFVLPGLVLHAMYYRNADGHCEVNTTALYSWALPNQLVINNAAAAVVILTYPIIWWKMRHRRVAVGVTGSSTVASRGFKGGTSINSTPGGDGKDQSKSPHEDEVEAIQKDLGAPHAGQLEESGSQQHRQPPLVQPTGPGTSRKSMQSFRVLTYLVVSVVICWIPIMTFYTLAILIDYDNYWYWVVGSLLYYLNSLLDPILFTLAITPIRTTVRGFFSHQ